MEYEPIITLALIYADEIINHFSMQPMLQIKCPNEEIKAILHSLYYNILNIEHNLGWARTMCKYAFVSLLDLDDNWALRCIGVPQEIERLEEKTSQILAMCNFSGTLPALH